CLELASRPGAGGAPPAPFRAGGGGPAPGPARRAVGGAVPAARLPRRARRRPPLERALAPLLARERERAEIGQHLSQPLERDRLADEIERAELEACARLDLGGDTRDDHHRHLRVAHRRKAPEPDAAPAPPT